MIEVSGLSKQFGNITAVDDINISIGHGEIVGLVGPNGAGKTTLIKMLIGMMRPTEGEINVMGEPMPEGRDNVARYIGYMPQIEAIYPDLTVRENLDFFARLYGIEDQGEREEAIAESLEFIGLTERSESIVNTLSGGMRRRVSLGAALIHRPRLAVLDEPTVGLDPDLRANMWNGFYQLASEGTTVLLSTHYMGEADRCSRIALLNRGRIIADGTPSDLKSAVPWETSLVITTKRPITREAVESALGARLASFEVDGRLLTIHPGEVEPADVIEAVERVAGIVHADRTLPSIEDAFLYYAGGSR